MMSGNLKEARHRYPAAGPLEDTITLVTLARNYGFRPSQIVHEWTSEDLAMDRVFVEYQKFRRRNRIQ